MCTINSCLLTQYRRFNQNKLNSGANHWISGPSNGVKYIHVWIMLNYRTKKNTDTLSLCDFLLNFIHNKVKNMVVELYFTVSLTVSILVKL